jgi:hypothetical protein
MRRPSLPLHDAIDGVSTAAIAAAIRRALAGGDGPRVAEARRAARLSDARSPILQSGGPEWSFSCS